MIKLRQEKVSDSSKITELGMEVWICDSTLYPKYETVLTNKFKK